MSKVLECQLSPRHWTIMFHLMKHMPEQLRRWGPVKDHWMFGFEDFFGHNMQWIHSNRYPVASMYSPPFLCCDSVPMQVYSPSLCPLTGSHFPLACGWFPLQVVSPLPLSTDWFSLQGYTLFPPTCCWFPL